MNINGTPLAECSDDQVRGALEGLIKEIGSEYYVELMTLQQELERRASIARGNFLLETALQIVKEAEARQAVDAK
jgi:hypothetical protein